MRTRLAATLATLTLFACDRPRPAATDASASPRIASSAAPASSSAPGAASPPSPSTSRADAARALAELLGRGDFAGALERADPSLAKVLTASALESAWKESAGDAGAFRRVDGVTARRRREREVHTVVVALERGTMDVVVGFGPEAGGAPTALYLKPARPPYEVPAYVDRTKLEEHEVEVGSEDLAMGGTAVVPKGAPGFPVVVMLAGSGPQDRDGTTAAARPLRDLALGLATRGVGSIRWDKRTTEPPALGVAPADATVEHEYLQDAAAAIALARGLPFADPARVFVLGHSQGGWLTPWVLERNPEVAGGILLAGVARHFNAIVPSQLEYMAKLDDGVVGPLERLQIEQVREQCARAQKVDLPLDTPPSDLPLGVPATYWRAIVGYDAVATAKKTPQPYLFLQGERDYQVTPADDLAVWKVVAASKKGSAAKLYRRLNHFFIAGEGRIEPKEYATLRGHMSEEVVEDIAEFVGAPRR